MNQKEGMIIVTLKCKTSMIWSNLCYYIDAYILVKGTTTVLNRAAAGAAVNNTTKKVIFKNCAPFTDCITKTRDNVLLDPQQRLFNLLKTT